MASLFSKFRKSPRLADDNEKAQLYESDATRPTSRSANLVRRAGVTSSRPQHVGSFAPNPAFIRALRLFLYSVTSLSALAFAGVGLSVVQYYNSHGPVIKPAWGSLIAGIVIGIGTPGAMFGLYFVTPHLFRHGGVGAILNQTRIEVVLLFNLSVIWISVALAVASDLRGRSNCIWDGYYHYPKPSDFDDVCNLINVSVALSYTTFGLCALQMSIFNTIMAYILLYLDQEVLTEPTHDMGGRAYRARLQALDKNRALSAAQTNAVSTAGPSSAAMSQIGSGAGPLAGGAVSSRALPAGFAQSSNAPGPMAGGRYRDEEGGRSELEDSPVTISSRYYGYDAARV